jgi:hypothetical protein
MFAGESVVSASVRSRCPPQEEHSTSSTVVTRTVASDLPLNAALMGASGRAPAWRDLRFAA